MKHYQRPSPYIEQLKFGLIIAFISGLIMLANECAAQTDTFIGRKWKEGKEIRFGNHTIVKVQSKGYGYTNIFYSDSSELIQKAIKSGKEKMQSASEIEAKIRDIKARKPGGELLLYIGRLTIGSGNTEYFRIVVQDMNGNELMNHKLGEDIPEVPGMDQLWWNIDITSLPEEISKPFIVFVIDELDDKNPKHQFIIR